MPIRGKQLEDSAISTVKIAANAVTSAKVDSSVLVSSGANAMTGNLSAGGFKITSLGTPTADGDASTKAYVDAVAAGLDVKKSVRLATAAALPANTRTGNVLTYTANGAITAIDGVTPVLNDRILVKDEATGANNGIYFVSDVGSAGTPAKLTRTTDADETSEVTAGLFTFIEEGTANADTQWILTTDGVITLNTTSLAFTQYGSTGVTAAGAGLTKTGNTIDVVIASGSAALTANANDISVNYGLVGTIANVTKAAAAAGTAETVARADHKHDVTTAAAGTIAVADTAAEGTSTSLARADHRHALPAPAAPANVTKAAADAGVATTVARADHKHDVATAAPVSVGTANSEGTSASLARADHVHASPAPVTSNKAMTASVTVSDGDQATATTVAANNALGGYVGMMVNGIAYIVGNGTKVSVDAYFSNDGGATARAMSAISAADTCRWNGSVAGFQLAASDKVDFMYGAF